MPTLRSKRCNRARSRGNVMVEFSLIFVALVALVFAAFDFSYPVFARTTLHHAVREGARFAITGRTLPGMGHDDSIREIVRQNALGLLDDPVKKIKIKIHYYPPDGTVETGANAAGNIVKIRIVNFPVPRVAPITWGSEPIQITVSAVDRMSFFEGSPPAR